MLFIGQNFSCLLDILHGMKRGLRSPLSNQPPPSSLDSPSNSGLQGPSFQPPNITFDPLKQT